MRRMTLIDQPGLEPGEPGAPGAPEKDPRPGHKGVDDPRKAPAGDDPSIRKGPLGDPKVPGFEIDPPVPGDPPADPPMQV